MGRYIDHKNIAPAALVVIYLFLALTAVFCLLPIINVIAISLSGSAAVAGKQVSLWPVSPTIDSFRFVLARSAFWKALGITVLRVGLGTSIQVFLVVLMAYPLSREAHKLPGRGFIVGFLLFAMIFSGGLVPMYILIRDLKLYDTIWALVLPTAVNIANVILVLNYMRQLPKEIEEAAFIDGCSYLTTLFRIIIPISLPVIATISLFGFVWHWNSWFDGLVFMRTVDRYPLQTFLHLVVSSRDLKSMEEAVMFGDVDNATIRAAQIVLTMLPIVVIYPLLQRYFAKGIVLGSVKG